MTFKIGYTAKRTGFVDVDSQVRKLREFGCDVIYGANETVYAAIQALREPDDLFVVCSAAIIGRPALPRVMAALGEHGVDLHSLAANMTFPTRDAAAIKLAWDDIIKVERRTGGKGGAPKKYSLDKMQALRDEGYNNADIAKEIGCSPATVGRTMGDHR